MIRPYDAATERDYSGEIHAESFSKFFREQVIPDAVDAMRGEASVLDTLEPSFRDRVVAPIRKPSERELMLEADIRDKDAIIANLNETMAIQRATIVQLSKTVVQLREREMAS